VSTGVVEAQATRPARHAGCPSCGGGGLEVFHEQQGVPVHSCRLVETRAEALAFPTGTLKLAFCPGCGFITNIAYDPALQDYGVAYEETQGFSPRFREFLERLARRWIERYDLHGKDVLELGCGKGEFLSLLCELGPNRGVGIDPAFVEERLESEAARRMRFVADLYSERYADVPCDALVCRHTLEHIGQVGEFMALARRTIGERDAAVLFDLPDVVRVLREGAFWDVYYEHCSYFSPGSLARLFRRSGFRVLDLELDYDDQYIVLEARAADGAEADEPLPLEETPGELEDDVEAFRQTFAATAAKWREVLAAARADGRRVAIWGAGSKAVAFLTTLASGDEIAYAVDINPYKQGKYLAGTGHEVLGPDALRERPPELVIAMNAVYVDEIGEQLSALGLGATKVVGV
jgi:cyclopropane fatty-acyl-phospholipid synthase-like methyltransferase